MRLKPLSNLTAEEVRSRLHYDPSTGVFTWIRTKGALAKGSRAGHDHKGYTRIGFGGHAYMASRLAWLIVTGAWPPDDREIDHENLVRNDDRWVNLRLAEHGQNMANRTTQRTGLKGASPHHGRWRARVTKDGANHLIGVFDTEQEAYEAYCTAAARLHGGFYRG
jgi:hypothetical protein